jgi:hypothetical protein
MVDLPGACCFERCIGLDTLEFGESDAADGSDVDTTRLQPVVLQLLSYLVGNLVVVEKLAYHRLKLGGVLLNSCEVRCSGEIDVPPAKAWWCLTAMA